MLVRRALCTVTVAAVLALTGCGGGDTGTTAADDDGKQAVDLEFTVDTVDGGTFEGASLAGQPAVLWFWAPWCVTCAAEAPHVAELAQEYGQRVRVAGVAGLSNSADAMQSFIDMTGVDNIPHLADSDGVVWQRFEIAAQSSFVVLDADGAVVLRGVLTPSDVRERLETLVA